MMTLSELTSIDSVAHNPNLEPRTSGDPTGHLSLKSLAKYNSRASMPRKQAKCLVSPPIISR